MGPWYQIPTVRLDTMVSDTLRAFTSQLRIFLHKKMRSWQCIMSNANGKARFWIGTVWTDSPGGHRLNQLVTSGNIESPLCYLRGQTEICPSTSKAHYQVVAGFERQVRLRTVKGACGEGHWEASKSAAVDAYVWKDASAVPESRFEIGEKAIRRNVAADWDKVKELAISGRINEVPSDIFIRFIMF